MVGLYKSGGTPYYSPEITTAEQNTPLNFEQQADFDEKGYYEVSTINPITGGRDHGPGARYIAKDNETASRLLRDHVGVGDNPNPMRILVPRNNGPNGPKGPAGPGNGLGGPEMGSPVYLDRTAQMAMAQADAQTSVDNANAGARARAAAQGLDYNPNAYNQAVNQSVVSTQANNAGFNTDKANVGFKNQFEFDKMNQGFQDRRMDAQLNMQQKELDSNNSYRDRLLSFEQQKLKQQRGDNLAAAKEYNKNAGIYYDPVSRTFKNMNLDPSYQAAVRGEKYTPPMKPPVKPNNSNQSVPMPNAPDMSAWKEKPIVTMPSVSKNPGQGPATNPSWWMT